MDIQDKTKEEIIEELQELRQENNSLKELYYKENSLSKCSYDEMLETNLKLTLAMQGGNMAWWEMDVPTGNVTFDKHKVEMLGYPPEKFTHYSDFTTLVHPEDYKRIMNAMKGHFDGTLDKYEAEYRIQASSGEYIWFYDYGSVIKRDSKGKPLICTGFVFNITDRKKAELNLLKITKAIESISDAIAISDSQGHHFYQNKALSDLFGYETAEELEAAGGGMARVKDPAIAKQMFKAILHGKSWSGELEMVTKTGRVFPAYERADAIKDKEGNIIGVIGIITDITEKQEFEKKMLRDKIFADQLINSLPGLFYVTNAEGKFINWNKNLETVSGYSYNEMAEISPLDFFAGADKLNIGKNIIQVFAEGYASAGATFISKNQTKTPYYFTGKKITIDNQIYLSGLGIDISAQKTNEENLRRSENMLQTVLDNFPGVVFWKDRQSIYLGCNQSFATGAGLKSPAEIVGKTDYETPWASTEAINYLKDDRNVMKSGKGRMHIIETQHQSDGQVIWLDTSKFPMRDSSGQVIGVIGVSNDISTLMIAEQKLINTNKELVFHIKEKEKREQELIKALGRAEESDRLKSAFLANMSHEIRTPMNGILGFAGILKEVDLSGEERKEYLELMERSGNRMLNIINDIVDISKIESGLTEVHLKESNINEQIDYIYTFFKPEMDKKSIQFSCKKSLSGKEAVIHTDREKVYSILTNLVKNALKYTNEGSIEFGYDLVETQCIASLPNSTMSLQFYVKDTGIGIAKDRQEAIFERFIQANITDKMARQGAGLGLSISKAFVELLGGKILVRSKERIGSTFYFTLPYNAEPKINSIVQNVLPTEHTASHIKRLNILIAEDDETSEILISMQVNKLSSKVLKARNGNEVVEICRCNPDLDLILMDIRMPDLDGYEATRQIRLFNKEIVIIAQTAYGLFGDREKAIEAGCNDYIAKPVHKDALLSLIQKFFKL